MRFVVMGNSTLIFVALAALSAAANSGNPTFLGIPMAIWSHTIALGTGCMATAVGVWLNHVTAGRRVREQREQSSYDDVINKLADAELALCPEGRPPRSGPAMHVDPDNHRKMERCIREACIRNSHEVHEDVMVALEAIRDQKFHPVGGGEPNAVVPPKFLDSFDNARAAVKRDRPGASRWRGGH